MAQLWGVEDLPDRRREAADVLAEHMLDIGELERVWSILSSDEQDALATLLREEGAIPWTTFTRRWGEVRTMGPGRMARERPWEAPISPAERLWYWGLIFRLPAQGPTGLHDVAFLPADLGDRLPARPTEPVLSLTSRPTPPIVHPASDHLLDDGCTLLAYLQTHPVEVDTEEGWPAEHDAALVRRLRDPNPDRLDLLRHLADQLDWLRRDSAGHLRPTPGPATEWLQAPITAQRSALAGAWRDDPSWNDLWRVPSLRPDDTGSWRNDPLLTRTNFLRDLAACRPGEWYYLDDLVEAIKETDPDFQRPDGDYTSWYIRDAATGTYLSGFDAWEAVEGALIRTFVTGPIFWLGMVDLGATQAEGPPVSFRLSAAGAAFLGLADTEPCPDEGEQVPFVVRPDLTVQAPAARRYDRFQLSRIADWVRTGEPYIYRLTAGSLERAQRERIVLERVTAFLKEVSGGDLPHAAQAALQRWASQGTEVTLERTVVLQVKDEQTLRQLQDDPAIRRYIHEVIGPRAALVAPQAWPRLRQMLVAAGFLPDVIGLEEV
ncbi:MAG: helicase-associated domain-containing protein [Anaerolineae bacterium]